MFIGHFGIGLAAKRLAPRTSLGTLFFAAQFLDLIWPIFLLLGLEHVRVVPGITAVSPFDFYDYPISHSLAAVVGWSAVIGILYLVASHYRRGALVVGIAVLSHWILDALVHRPDLPLFPGGHTRVGLGLWNSWPASIAVESVFFVAGLWIYLTNTRTRDKVGTIALWSLIFVLVAGWISTLVSKAPPSKDVLAWGALAMWLFVPWGWWVERHRESRLK